MKKRWYIKVYAPAGIRYVLDEDISVLDWKEAKSFQTKKTAENYRHKFWWNAICPVELVQL